MPLSTIFQLYHGGQFGGGNWSSQRKPPTCHKSLTNFTNLFDIYEVPRENNANSSSSCPANFGQVPNTPPQFMSEEEARMWQKDRQKSVVDLLNIDMPLATSKLQYFSTPEN
jgi:hypothetical protein